MLRLAPIPAGLSGKVSKAMIFVAKLAWSVSTTVPRPSLGPVFRQDPSGPQRQQDWFVDKLKISDRN